MDIPNFEDYSDKKTLDGDKVKIDDILNQSVIVTGFKDEIKEQICGKRLRRF